MHDEAGRLVDDDDVGILVEDFQRNRFARRNCRLGRGDCDDDLSSIAA
jgi:hypothetical protein